MNKQQDNQHADDTVIFGFWVYLMTDLMVFACLFATYAVLKNNTFGAISIHQLSNLPFVLVETLLLLMSSFTCGLSMVAAKVGSLKNSDKSKTISLLGVTFLLGIAFLAMEMTEFTQLVLEGNSWTQSGFLSAFFTLVGTHGLHILIGLLWIIVLVVQIWYRGFTASTMRKLACFSLFWHFLDIVWIFIFTIVYLLGAI